MLPSKGFFSVTPCPYLSSGSHSRVFCQLKHGQDFGEEKENEKNEPGYTPTPIAELKKRHIPVIPAASKPSRSYVIAANGATIVERKNSVDEPAKVEIDMEEKGKFGLDHALPQALVSDNQNAAQDAVNSQDEAREWAQTSKMKIAPASNVTQMLRAREEILAKLPKCSPVGSWPELAKSNRPVAKRIAHKPVLDTPKVKLNFQTRIPHSVRQLGLNLIYDEFRKYMDQSEAQKRATDEEVAISRRVHVVTVYQNSVRATLLKIRKSQGKCEVEVPVELRSEAVTDFTHGKCLYECFARYLLSEEDLRDNGFPLELEEEGCGYVHPSARRNPAQPKDKNKRICSNCKEEYAVDDSGYPLTENDCVYHWGRTYVAVTTKGTNRKYSCCGNESDDISPCTSGQYHVSTFDEDRLESFVHTRPLPQGVDVNAAGIYSLDCEMCYTTKGLELARVTVVDLNFRVIYDAVVRPNHPVLDYCTRFSGMTPDAVQSSRTTLHDVQNHLLTFIYDKTILVGHSIENDLKVLRLFHKTIVDTSLVFPHKLGAPHKLSLKLLAKDSLKRTIQDSESGHDSTEDAETCLALMFKKIKEDAKSRKPRVIIGASKRNPKLNSAEKKLKSNNPQVYV